MLDPRRLAVLRAFNAEGTIAAAAEALNFTSSAVSQQLAQLQREAGVELFRKAGRRLELTDAGALLAARADELLARVEQVESELATQAGEVSGTVTVAAFQTAARQLAIPALDALSAPYPHLTVQLLEAEAEESLPLLARGAIAVAIAEEYEHAPRPRLPRQHRLYLEPDELLVALPRGHDEGPVALSSLKDATWASARTGTAYNDMFERVCRSEGGFEPIIGHRVNDLDLLTELVARGRAAALVPSLGQPERDPRIAVRPLAEGRVTRALFVAVRDSDRERPSTAAIVNAISAAGSDRLRAP